MVLEGSFAPKANAMEAFLLTRLKYFRLHEARIDDSFVVLVGHGHKVLRGKETPFKNSHIILGNHLSINVLMVCCQP